MPENRREEVVKIIADTSGVGKPLADVAKQMERVKSVAKEVGKSIADAPVKGIDKLKDACTKMNTQLDSVFKGNKDGAKAITEEFVKINKAAKNFDMKPVQASIDRTIGRIDTLRSRLDKAMAIGNKPNSKLVSGLQFDLKAQEDKFKRLGDVMSSGLSERIIEITSQMKQLEGTRVPTVEFEKLSTKLEKSREKANGLLHELNELRANPINEDTVLNTAGYKKLSDQLREVQERIVTLRQEESNFAESDKLSGKYQMYASQVDRLRQSLSQLNAEQQGMSNAIPGIADAAQRMTYLNEKIDAAKSNMVELNNAWDSARMGKDYPAMAALGEQIKAAHSELTKLQSDARSIAINYNVKDLEQFVSYTDKISRTEEQFVRISDAMSQMSQNGTKYSEGYRNITEAIKGTEQEAQKLMSRLNAYPDAAIERYTDRVKYLEGAYKRAAHSADNLVYQQERMKAAGTDSVAGVDSDAYKALQSELQQSQEAMANLESQTERYAGNTKRTLLSMFQGVTRGAKSTGQSIFKHIGNAFKKIAKSGKRHIQSLIKDFNKLKKQQLSLSDVTKKFTKSFTSMFTMLKARLKRLAISAIFKDMQQNFNTIAKISPRFNDAVSEMIDSFKQLGAQIVASIEPIVSVVGPVISQLVDKLTEGADAISQFFARLTGNDEYLKASKGHSNYAASLDDETSSTKKATKAAKEYKNTVMDFDELHKLNGVDDDDNVLGIDDASIDKALTQANALNEIADRIRAAFKAGDFKGVGKAMASGINQAFAWVQKVAGWSKNIDKFTGYLRSFIDVINGFVEELDPKVIGTAVGDVVNTIIHSVDMLTDPQKGIKFKLIGKQIGTSLIRALTTIDWKAAGRAFINSIQSGVKLLNGLLESEVIDETTGEKMSMGKAIGRALNDAFKGALESLDPKEWGDIIANVINTLTGAINELLGDQSKIKEFTNKLTEALDKAIKGINGDDLAAAISNVAKSLVTIVGGVMKTLIKDGFELLKKTVSSDDFDWKALLEAMGILAVPGIISGTIKKGLAGLGGSGAGAAAAGGVGGAVKSVAGSAITAVIGSVVTDAVADNFKKKDMSLGSIVGYAATKTVGYAGTGAAIGAKYGGAPGAALGAGIMGLVGLGKDAVADVPKIVDGLKATSENTKKQVEDLKKAVPEADFSNLKTGLLTDAAALLAGGGVSKDANAKASLWAQMNPDKIAEDANSAFVTFGDKTKAVITDVQSFVDAFGGNLSNVVIEVEGEMFSVTDAMRKEAQSLIDRGIVEFGDVNKKYAEAYTSINQQTDTTKTSMKEMNDTISHATDRVAEFAEQLYVATKNMKTTDNKSVIASGIGSLMSAMSGLMSGKSIAHYAQGGIVGDGQLFIANENGTPELIGSDGRGNTAIVNNEQIIKAVVTGVKQGVTEAMIATQHPNNNQSTRGGDIVMVADGREIARAVNAANRLQDQRSNHTFAFV